MIRKLDSFLDKSLFHDLALLSLRLAFGLSMMFLHGIAKFNNFASLSQTFPDPLGIGSSQISLILALAGELVGPAMIALGFFTRLGALPAAITMGVATFIVHAGDPWDKKELAFLYFVAFSVIFLIGAGRFSIDRVLQKK